MKIDAIEDLIDELESMIRLNYIYVRAYDDPIENIDFIEQVLNEHFKDRFTFRVRTGKSILPGKWYLGFSPKPVEINESCIGCFPETKNVRRVGGVIAQAADMLRNPRVDPPRHQGTIPQAADILKTPREDTPKYRAFIDTLEVHMTNYSMSGDLAYYLALSAREQRKLFHYSKQAGWNPPYKGGKKVWFRISDETLKYMMTRDD